MLIEGKDNIDPVEVDGESEEELEIFDFMVEDKDETNKACLTCVGHRVGNRVCGIFKVILTVTS